MAKDFRFAMSMRFIKSREAFVDKVRRAAEELSQRLNYRPKNGPNAGSKYMKALGL